MKRVLVVEDEPQLLQLVVRKLTSKGAQVVGVSNAADALEAFRRFNFDVVLSDVGLGPGASGIELLKWLRQMFYEVEFYIWTANPKSEDRAFVESLGGKYLEKPISLEVLAEHLGL